MARWTPDARDRLFRAAMELFDEVGFEQATVADIAARAGLTERTFFRYFTDKREVLFTGGAPLSAAVLDAVLAAPAPARPLELVTAALDAMAAELQPRLPLSRERARIVATHPSLRERELTKLADLTTTLGEGLRQRGVPDPTASLAAEVGMAAFRVAYDRWAAGDDDDLAALMHTTLADLALTAATPPPTRRPPPG